jgi:hypothetical protein
MFNIRWKMLQHAHNTRMIRWDIPLSRWILRCEVSRKILPRPPRCASSHCTWTPRPCRPLCTLHASPSSRVRLMCHLRPPPAARVSRHQRLHARPRQRPRQAICPLPCLPPSPPLGDIPWLAPVHVILRQVMMTLITLFRLLP